jgi:CBS domain containing-hemolysin-like protein
MEIAFISSNKLKIELDKGKGMVSGRILSSFTREPSRLVGTLLLGNNIALVIYGIAMANALEPSIARWLSGFTNPEYLILLIQTIVATLLILLLGEFLPKTLFRMNANAFLNTFSLILWGMYYLLYPFVYLFSVTSEFILKVFFRMKFTNQEKVFTPIDLDEYIREFSPPDKREDEVQQEIQMFQNVIDFRKVKVRECMVPRTEIIAVDARDSIENLKKEFIQHGVSRIPVYEESIDNITGYIHSFDLFTYPQEIKKIIKPIIFVPETMLANVVLTRFIQDHKNIAVVLDEFGGTSGLVTMEDVIEEIFGEIEDEFDAEDLIEKKISEDEYVFSARLEIDYLNEKYRLSLPESDDYETLAGFIINFHESIPDPGEKIDVPPFVFEIIQATENRIELVKLRIKNE